MGRFTPEELARAAPGRSPEELVNYNMTDGEWAKKGAEIQAAHAEAQHNLEMAKAAGVSEIDTLRFAPEIVELAKLNLGTQKLDDAIESIVAPVRAEFLASFDTKAPVAKHRVGLNEKAFNALIGGAS